MLVLAVLQGASTEEVGLVRTTCRSLLSFLGRTVPLSAPFVRPPVFNAKRSSHVQLTARRALGSVGKATFLMINLLQVPLQNSREKVERE